MFINEEDFFVKWGITGINNVEYARNNIIVGENGAGKSRFLKSIREYYNNILKCDKENIIYAYIPGVSSEYVNKDDKHERDWSLYDLIGKKVKISFDDFIKYVEDEGAAFIAELFNMTHSIYKMRVETSNKIIKKLNAFLLELDGRELAYNNDKIIAKKGNIIISLDELLVLMSPGERLLFYLSIFMLFITDRYTDSDDIIIIIDEPELHLHTKALSKFINLIKNEVHYKALWIATHAYSIIPEFDFNEIVYINNSEIQNRNSKLYYHIFNSLIGANNLKLYNFLVSLDNWEYYNFIAECFCLPQTVTASNTDDPQFLQFCESMKALDQNNLLKILDYGGGEGRIGKCINILKNRGDNSLNHMEYHIYEPYPNDTNNEFILYKSINEIEKAGNKYNCIILMNVLHEIDITKWKKTFENIYSFLKQNGYLLFVEASSLTYGEQPYCKNGYLVLYKEQIAKLFKTNDIININISKKSNCFLIKNKYLPNVSDYTIRSAIVSLQKYSYDILQSTFCDKIESALLKKKEELSIRKYAYFSQLYINSMFALNRIDVKIQKQTNFNIENNAVKNTISDDDLFTSNNRNEYSFEQNIKTISAQNIERTLDKVWKRAIELEKTSNDKDEIVKLLLANAKSGHEKSKNRLNNNYKFNI